MPIWIITGANRGLGLEFATQLSSSPSNTIIACTRTLSRSLSALSSLKSKSNPNPNSENGNENENENFHILECDTSSESSITTFASTLSALLGPSTKIDYLLNNAGINANSQLTSLTFTPESLSTHMQTNVLGPALLVQSLLPHLQQGTVVMNMTSGLGSLSFNSQRETAECTVYAMSKAALNMLTVHQAKQLGGRGVRVVCVDPGWVKTDMGGEGAVLEREVSVKGVLGVLNGLGEGDSGRFFGWDGVVREW
ncbi:hypothetical protein EG329_006314 [Mollisiaceae sp. DMI_Dod_QoI]|nr:hypothetical protein EG329_006314 [Helotiales sp. DMI_Dod_QoI]